MTSGNITNATEIAEPIEESKKLVPFDTLRNSHIFNI